MGKLTCVLIGGGSLLLQCAEILRTRGHQIAAIATTSAQVRAWAAAEKIQVIDAGTEQALELDYDWLFSIANLKLVPTAMWQHAKIGAANFHDGLLPQTAGVNTPAWSIIDGHSRHGVTWHALNDGIDEGDVYVQQAFDINADETALTLNTKCFEAGIATFAKLIADIENDTLSPRAQDFSTRTYHGRLKRPEAAATLDFAKPAMELSRLVRGLDFGQTYHNPLALPKVRCGKDVFAVSHIRVLAGELNGEPGLVMSVGAHGVTVATADMPVLLEAVKIGGVVHTPLSSDRKSVV